MTKKNKQENSTPSNNRLMIGGTIFIVGILCPLLVPIIILLDLPEAWELTISGFLLLGIPELFTLIAVAVLGKPGFKFLKKHVFNFLKDFVLPDVVGHTRYRVGLVLFIIPIILGWMSPYLAYLISGLKRV